MSEAHANVGMPISLRVAKLKQSIVRLEELLKYYPDMTVKSDPARDIYQSNLLWKDAIDIEVLNNTHSIAICPYRDIEIFDTECLRVYRVYTNPMSIALAGKYTDYENAASWKLSLPNNHSLKDYSEIIQFYSYMTILNDFPYNSSIIPKIEDALYLFLKRTVLENPSKYKFEDEKNLPEKLQILITFA